ncbi:hypothetical protein CHS0354_040500 [Potamilus streckersoni]|uniref:Uncharacterized protein n=1 Tax=Potamilus streckersoni TaxID=2493646 RepID=A0AAE0TLM2_9BIVA|nr:hypothetical protein CHS0354_040500 [Potamilus streckersoni]
MRTDHNRQVEGKNLQKGSHQPVVEVLTGDYDHEPGKTSRQRTDRAIEFRTDDRGQEQEFGMHVSDDKDAGLKF